MSVPEQLGRLQRVRRLGAGGFATVWLYRDTELQSHVAVKALADNWAQRLDVRQRFLDEARILRAADSDHVVRVHDLGETDGTPWFVMTYADLGSLDVALTGDPWEPRWVTPIIDQAAAGLAVLHAGGVVHRDVKPQNLLIRGEGEPTGPHAPPARPGPPHSPEVLASGRLMVADLGVAKALLHASGLTQVVGTPAYMAPEQATGEGLDTRADVHALGAVAYHLLTGRVLRGGGFADLVEGPPPIPPSELAPLPAEVDAVLLRAVDPRPDERWDDVGSFAAALGEALRQPSSGVTRPDRASVTTVREQPAGRRAAPLRAVALVLVVLLVTFVVAYVVVRALVQ